MSTETLLKQLEEYESLPCSPGEQEYRKLILQILKQQQQTISEQNALIETLWAWAEERDEETEIHEADERHQLLTAELERETEQENNSLSPNEYDASIYTRIM